MESNQVWRRTKKGSLVVWHFFKETFQEWSDDKAMRLSAALAYYSLFSIAPLLIITIFIAGLFFGEQAVQGEIVQQLQDLIGTEGAVLVEDMLRRTRLDSSGLVPMLISLGTMLFGSIIVFNALQDTLNMIWGVRREPNNGILSFIIRRLFSFLMVVLIGVFLLISLLATTILASVEAYFQEFVAIPVHLWRGLDLAVWFGFFTLSFAMMYKMLPDARIAWRDVWFGSMMTSILFGVGKYAISLYLARSAVGSVFGAAGTLVVLMVWIYYSWVIIFFGAEMTQVFARQFGHGIKPSKQAVRREKHRDRQQ